MPLNTQLQDVNRIMDPGVKSFSTDMGAFNLAYQYAANRRREKDEQEQAFGQLTSSLQTDSSGKSVPQLLAEFSQLPVDQMEQKIATMAPMAMTPAGSRIISVFSNIADKKRMIENQSAKKLLESEYNRRVAGALAKFGGNPQDPASISKAMRNQSYFEVLDLAKGHSKDPSLPLPDDAIDDMGMINMQAVQQWIGSLPASERIQSAETLARERMDSQREINDARIQARQDMLEFKLEHGGGYTPGALQKDIDFIDSLNLPDDQKDLARNRRLAIEAKPAVQRTPTSKGDYVKTRIDAFMKSEPKETVDVPSLLGTGTTQKEVPITRDRAVTLLGQEYDRIYKPKSEPTGKPSASKSSEVIRVTKDGKKAVFDADTKAFIRYAD